MLTGEQIRDLREAKGLRQDQLAALIGVAKNSVSNWERGITSPRRYMGRIRRVLLAADDSPTHNGTTTEDDVRAALRAASDTDLLAEVARRFGGR